MSEGVKLLPCPDCQGYGTTAEYCGDAGPCRVCGKSGHLTPEQFVRYLFQNFDKESVGDAIKWVNKAFENALPLN